MWGQRASVGPMGSMTWSGTEHWATVGPIDTMQGGGTTVGPFGCCSTWALSFALRLPSSSSPSPWLGIVALVALPLVTFGPQALPSSRLTPCGWTKMPCSLVGNHTCLGRKHFVSGVGTEKLCFWAGATYQLDRFFAFHFSDVNLLH